MLLAQGVFVPHADLEKGVGSIRLLEQQRGQRRGEQRCRPVQIRIWPDGCRLPGARWLIKLRKHRVM
jgi:hypothetical protein